MQKSGFDIKKLLLAVGVLAAFVIYSFGVRHSDDSKPVIAPASTKNSSSNTSTTAPSSSQGTTSSGSSSGSTASSAFKNGTYTGSIENAYYGNIQVQAVISGGKLTDVVFLQYPNDNPNSQNINSQAMPLLKQEAVQAQSGNVDTISGASDTSQAFVQSLNNALSQAQA